MSHLHQHLPDTDTWMPPYTTLYCKIHVPACLLFIRILNNNLYSFIYKREVVKECLPKEGRRLDLTAPFGELDSVGGVLFTASG